MSSSESEAPANLDEECDTPLDNKPFKRPSKKQKNPKGYISIDMGENSQDQETYHKNTPKV